MKDMAGNEFRFYDLEVFPNFFLATFTNGTKWWTFELSAEKRELARFCSFLHNCGVLVGFNSFSYDDLISRFIYQRVRDNGDCTNADIYDLSQKIIKGGRNDKGIFQLQYAKEVPWGYTVDVFQLVNKKGALKEWECRQRARKVIESSADFEKPLPRSEFDNIRAYCRNDTYETFRLFKSHKHLYDLRVKLAENYDLPKRIFAIGDAGIAQMVLTTLHERRTGLWSAKLRAMAKDSSDNSEREYMMTDIISPRVSFLTEEFQDIEERLRESSAVGDSRGITWHIKDSFFKKPVKLAGVDFKIGLGGLHSDDGPGVFVASKTIRIIDLDVTSYYPSIMIEEELFPQHLGVSFINDFTALRDARVAAKKSGDKVTNEALKIVINSTFGKLNDEYAPIRSIINALRVTVNGQLFLLMLIERLALKGFKILSANTDGVTISMFRTEKSEEVLKSVMAAWSKKTRHELEMNEFKIYARRDVNNYIAEQLDGKVKKKGAFQNKPPTGKWDGMIIKMAAEAYFLKGIQPKDFIAKAKNPADFLFYQRVQNGGHIAHGDKIIGRIARWYVAKEGKQIYRVKDGAKAKIPDGSNAQLMLDISSFDYEFPADIDLEYYIKETMKLIKSTEKP